MFSFLYGDLLLANKEVEIRRVTNPPSQGSKPLTFRGSIQHIVDVNEQTNVEQRKTIGNN